MPVLWVFIDLFIQLNIITNHLDLKTINFMRTSLNSAFGELTLHRYPRQRHQQLQAWDASDEYLLSHINDQLSLNPPKNTMIFNDSFGALSLSLNRFETTTYTDSFISHKAIIYNAKINSIDDKKLNVIHTSDELSGLYDTVLIKVPKTLDFLRDFLAKIRPFLHQDTQVICAGMIKSLPKSVWKILEETVGKTTTSLAKKKARLIFAQPEKSLSTSDYPKYFVQDGTGYHIYSHANVFSKDSFDIGTRFLLANIPTFDGIKNAIDLGCGNGIVGLNLAKHYPNARVTFIDESYMAVDSARLTMNANGQDVQKHQFLVNNCLDGYAPDSTDLIVCNPPFHQSHAIGLHIALQMFKQSFKSLKKGGHLIVIANRHLPYYPHLKKTFGHIKNIASNRKFCLYHMTK